MNSIRQSPWALIFTKSTKPVGYGLIAFVVYKIVEGFYYNSKARKKAVYENCAQQAKIRVA